MSLASLGAPVGFIFWLGRAPILYSTGQLLRASVGTGTRRSRLISVSAKPVTPLCPNTGKVAFPTPMAQPMPAHAPWGGCSPPWLCTGPHKTTTRQLQDNYKTTHKTTHKTTPFCWQACAFVQRRKYTYIFSCWTAPV